MKDILDSFRLGHHEFNGGKDGFELNGLDPYQLFELWTSEAVDTKEVEPNAFVLSTVNSEGQASSRIVYLKDILEGQFIFYTNYASKKGANIATNSKVSMLFFWANSSRQIRMEGVCSKVAPSVSDAYFAYRPRGSQIGAWASNQSDELLDRSELENKVKNYESKFPNEVPRPEHWGGYGIEPIRFEFWQGRPSRLHDRIEFEKKNDAWSIRRLNP
ncbi:MAG: pyridoxamine 5'-phosphate oxidase [Crocinitomicaceae bacterium]|nr:pyridoxamine 5'-phosphate oxidase [Crocinitomicaceae bacterium]